MDPLYRHALLVTVALVGFITSPRLYAQKVESFKLEGFSGLPYDHGGHWCAAASDFDGDGDIDLFVGRSFQSAQILLNDGAGHFTQMPDTADWQGRGGSHDLLLIDLNGDARKDLVVARGPEHGGRSASACRLFPGRDQILISLGGGRFKDVSRNLPRGDSLLNDLDPSCALWQLEDTVNFSMGVATGDFNKDGYPDLVFANGGIEYLPDVHPLNNELLLSKFQSRLLKNDLYLGGPDTDGDGVINFRDASTSSGIASISDLSTDVVVADFNGDSFDDIFITNFYDAEIASLLSNAIDYKNKLYLNNPNDPGKFTLAADKFPATPLRPSTSATAADADGDGDIDLFVTNESRASGSSPTERSRLYLNDGSGKFADASANLPQDLPLNHSGFHAEFVDMNGDSRPDIFVGGGRNQLFINRGNGMFDDSTSRLPLHPATGIPYQFSTYGFAVADFNGDGRKDLALANSYEQRRLQLQTAAGSFVDSTSVNLPPDGENTEDVAVADLNGDGRLDIVTANLDLNALSIYLNTTPAGSRVPTFVDRSDIINSAGGARPQNCRGVDVADINGDGRLDIVLASSLGVRFYANTGNDGSGAPILADSTTRFLPIQEVILDVNRLRLIDIDGKGLLALYMPRGVANNVVNFNDRLFFWDKAERKFVEQGFLPPESTPNRTVDAADLNGDGWKELLVGSNFGGASFLYLSRVENGRPLYDLQQIFAGPAANAIFVDLNGDQRLDIWVASINPAWADYYMLSTGSDSSGPTWNERWYDGALDGRRDVIAADIDADGDNDVITTGSDRTRVIINSNNQFYDDVSTIYMPGEIFRQWTFGKCLALADFTGDGLLDLYLGRDNQDLLFQGVGQPAGVEPETDLNGAPAHLRATPNPSTGVTTITYTLQNDASVTLAVLNLLGEEVTRMELGRQPAGSHRCRIDFAGEGILPGVYFVSLRGSDRNASTMVVVR